MSEMLRKEDVLDALMNKINELEKNDAKADVVLGLGTAMSVVKLMSCEPVGEWREDIDKTRRWDWRRFYCPACGMWQTYGETKYCPNCGARVENRGKE